MIAGHIEVGEFSIGASPDMRIWSPTARDRIATLRRYPREQAEEYVRIYLQWAREIQAVARGRSSEISSQFKFLLYEHIPKSSEDLLQQVKLMRIIGDDNQIIFASIVRAISKPDFSAKEICRLMKALQNAPARERYQFSKRLAADPLRVLAEVLESLDKDPPPAIPEDIFSGLIEIEIPVRMRDRYGAILEDYLIMMILRKSRDSV